MIDIIMNIIFNKKILLGLLLFQFTLTNEVYSTTSTTFSIDGAVNITPTSSCDATQLMVYKGGTATLGDGDTSNGKAVFYLWNETGNLSQNMSEIRGNVVIKKDGDFLNESKLYIRKNIKDNTGDNANKIGNAVLQTNGLFINQAEIIIGSGTTLICGTFPDDNTRWDGLTDYQNRNVILNGFSWNKSTESVLRYYSYNNTNYSIDENKSTTLADAKDGKITIIPGAKIYDGSSDNGEINGGKIFLHKYIELSGNDLLYTKDDGRSPDINTNNDAANTAGENLKVNLKNATIYLFNDGTSDTGTSELANEIKINNIQSDSEVQNNSNISSEDKYKYKIKNMFSNLTFYNCTCRIPDDLGISYSASQKNGTAIVLLPNTNSVIYMNQSKCKRTLNEDIYQLYVGNNENNYSIVKDLFNPDSSIQDKIYHGIIDSSGELIAMYDKDGGVVNNNNNDGLVLINKSNGSKSTFSELFNAYVNYNCFIDLDNLSDIASDTNKNIKFNEFSNIKKIESDSEVNLTDDDETNNDVIKAYYKDLYIQLMGGNSDTQQISNKYNSDKDINGKVTLNLYNPWEYSYTSPSTGSDSYEGSIYRQLPSLGIVYSTIDSMINGNQAVEEYKNKSEDELLDILKIKDSYIFNFIKQTQYWSIITQENKNGVNETSNGTESLAYILNSSNMDINKIVVLGYLLNQDNLSKDSEYFPTFLSKYYSGKTNDEMLADPNLLQYITLFVEDTYGSTSDQYLAIQNISGDDNKLTHVLENLQPGKKVILNNVIEQDRQIRNKQINSNNKDLRITELVQKYDGPAFNRYKVNFENSTDSDGNNISNDNTKSKEDYIYSENFNYVVDSDCTNFSATNSSDNTKYFVSDTFSIGSNSAILVNNIDHINGNNEDKTKWNTLKESKILTKFFNIKKGSTFKLKGHLKIKKLKGSDFTKNNFKYPNT